jgi:peptidoglycan/LPS O-acetylase OafA/YrhL
MSMPVLNPDALPVLPTWARRAVYAVYVLAWAFISSVDAYYDDGDPFWIPGAWRVLINLSVFVAAFALLNAKKNPTELKTEIAKEDPTVRVVDVNATAEDTREFRPHG